MPELDTNRINKAIADRSDVFYWQTDRAVEPSEAGLIWADRHRYFTDEELVARTNQVLADDTLVRISPFETTAQTNLGNVNSVRSGVLASGADVIVRAHPKGVKNGYFHAEALAAEKAKQAGLPGYSTLAIHDYSHGDDFAFQVIEKLPGTAIKKWLESKPHDEALLLPVAGQMMARLHQITVDGFGPFDNEQAKAGKLVGIHRTFGDAVRAALRFNLDVLTKENIVSPQQAAAMTGLFSDANPLLKVKQAVLVHNDFADWNLLTDGQKVTGIIDWDECVGGDPVSDLACWSTFFEPERMRGFMEGYWQVADKPADFDEKFELLRLRYTLSKMVLRVRRYSWEPTEFMKGKIEIGKTHLAQSFRHFGI